MNSLVRSLAVTLALFASTACPAMASGIIGEEVEMRAMADHHVASPAMDCCLQMPGQGGAEHGQPSAHAPRASDDAPECGVVSSAFPVVCETETVSTDAQVRAAPPPRSFACRSMMRRE